MTLITTTQKNRRTALYMATAMVFVTSAQAQDTPRQDDSQVVNARNWTPFWGKRTTGYLTTNDGTELRYSVLLPEPEGRFPVLVKYSGYDSGSIGGPAYLQNDETFSVALDKALLDQGYAIMGVQARGTGCSEGTFDFLGREYGTDGRDAIEFAASQGWSDGNVGMFGWSWAGMSQLMTASERPEGLKAIAPGMVLGDPRSDSWAPGGVPAPEFVSGWHWYLDQRWQAVAESARLEADERCLERVAGNREGVTENSLAYKLMRHPLRDAWAIDRVIRDRTHLIEVPLLSMQTWQDEAVLAREGYYQETLDSDLLWIIQSNGPHDLYESRYFWDKLISFFDRFVKGEENGFDNEPRVEIWQETYSDITEGRHEPHETAQPSWTIHRDSYPVAVEPIVFSLNQGGTLTADSAGSGPADEYRYPVAGPDVNTYEEDNAWGSLKPDWQDGSLSYTSSPQERDLVIYGPGSADLWLSTTLSPDLDVQVTLTQLLPDGQEVYIQRGWLRMSARQQNGDKSTLLRPWITDLPETILPIQPGEPTLGRVEIFPFSHVFRKGTRLRVWIEAPGRTGGYGFDTYALPERVTLYHDEQYPSRIVLGDLQGIDVPNHQPPCGDLLKQPCRPDPLDQQ